jgi:cell wall-associated NlpC family hydrolase
VANQETQPTMLSKIAFQMAMLTLAGLPYRYGGSNPMTGYDCSGLAQEALSFVGIKPPGDLNAQGLYDWFSKPGNGQVGVKDVGALAFYKNAQGQVIHVAPFYDGDVILEARGGDSSTTNEEAAIEKNAFSSFRNYKHRKDFFAIIKPAGLPW